MIAGGGRLIRINWVVVYFKLELQEMFVVRRV